MSDCCQQKACDLEHLAQRQRRVLWIVLGINGVMFGVELASGLWANSLALTGDSLDMLGDAIAYGSSLYALRRGLKSQARSALLKGGIMFASAIAVFARAVYQVTAQVPPDLTIMGGMALLVLGTNLLCLMLLTRHRHDNLNMSSVWLCSRNDIIANTSVLAAAGLVSVTQSPLPDIIVGIFLALLFAKSAGTVLSQSWRQLQEA